MVIRRLRTPHVLAIEYLYHSDRLILSIVERLTASRRRWRRDLVLVDLGRESLIHDSATMTRAPNDAVGFSVSLVQRSSRVPRRDATTRRPFSRMAPRKPDTQWVHFRCAQGHKSNVGASPAPQRYSRSLPPTADASITADHSSGIRDLLFRLSLSTSPMRATQVSTYYFRAFRRFWPSVWLRVPLAPHAWLWCTPLFRAIG